MYLVRLSEIIISLFAIYVIILIKDCTVKELGSVTIITERFGVRLIELSLSWIHL